MVLVKLKIGCNHVCTVASADELNLVFACELEHGVNVSLKLVSCFYGRNAPIVPEAAVPHIIARCFTLKVSSFGFVFDIASVGNLAVRVKLQVFKNRCPGVVEFLSVG